MPANWYFCLALGLDDYYSFGNYSSGTHHLDTWAHTRGFNTYRDFYGRDTKRFVKWIGKLVERADEIHFNMDGLDVKRANAALDPNDNQQPLNLYVSYELWLVSRPQYANKLYAD